MQTMTFKSGRDTLEAAKLYFAVADISNPVYDMPELAINVWGMNTTDMDVHIYTTLDRRWIGVIDSEGLRTEVGSDTADTTDE